LRVLHCPTTTGGNAPSLARAERSLGLASHCVSFRPDPFGFDSDEVLAPPGTGAITFELRRWRLLWRALRQFDVIHFNFGRTLLPSRVSAAGLRSAGVSGLVTGLYEAYAGLLELRDLAWLRRAGKGIVVTFQGDDVRQARFLRERFAVHPADQVEAGYYDDASDLRKRRTIEMFDRYADRIFALNPDLLHLLPKRSRFLAYANIDVHSLEPDVKREEQWRGRKPLVVHAPTHRGVKGTRFVLDAIERLRQEGFELELRLVEGVPHQEALRLYRRADLVVDQLLVGWYGGLAVEAMALEIPVVCYVRDEDLDFVPEEMRRELPILRAEPSTLYAVLKEWLGTRRHQLAAVGRASRRYALRWHDPRRIAAMLKSEYESILSTRESDRPR